MLYNLIQILFEQEKYAIVKRVYNANNKPKYFVLVPQPNLEPKCFVMSELPYADDLKQNFKFTEPVVDAQIEDETFKRFFDSIDIWDDSCKVNVPLGPKMMLDSDTSKLANAVANKYLGHEFSFDGVDINELDDETNEFLESLKASWPEDNQQQEEAA